MKSCGRRFLEGRQPLFKRNFAARGIDQLLRFLQARGAVTAAKLLQIGEIRTSLSGYRCKMRPVFLVRFVIFDWLHTTRIAFCCYWSQQ